MSEINSRIFINFPKELLEKFPEEGKISLNCADEIWNLIQNCSFSELVPHNLGLEECNWESYIKLSSIRVAYALDALQKAGINSGKILDVGSYFGNFSLAFKKFGYQVDSIDFYGSYGNALSTVTNRLKSEDINVFDFENIGLNLEGIMPGTYDAILFMSAIEHIPHSPKPLLMGINNAMRDGGVVIIDTPNLAYEYKRQQALIGLSTHPLIKHQFESKIPFIGHHREYTTEELEWMLIQSGFEIFQTTHFNYSLYGLNEIYGNDWVCYQAMENDPLRREMIMTTGIKKAKLKNI